MMPTSATLLTPTPVQLHLLAHLWAGMCAHDRAGTIPMRLDTAMDDYVSLEGGCFTHTLYVAPELAELPEPAQRWVLARQLGHHARALVDGRRRLRALLTRRLSFVLAFVMVPIIAMVTSPTSWGHLVALGAITGVALTAAALASHRLRGIEATADTYAHDELGAQLTPDVVAEIAPPSCPWPRLGRLLQIWATTPDWNTRLATHGPHTDQPHNQGPHSERPGTGGQH